MKRWNGILLLLLLLTGCDSAATNMLYSSGGGSSGGGFTNTTPPWHVVYMVDAVHSGSPPTDSTTYSDGATVTVAAQGNLTWSPFPFIGWTTVDPGYNGFGANGGTLYVPGNGASDTFVIHSNVTLWAAWSSN